MKLVVVLAAALAVCGAAKLDRTYLPPASARTAGGSPGSLQTPLGGSQGALPKGGFTNEHQGVVVDAVAAGTRSSDPTDTGLGAPRQSYGSHDSKVGTAAFKLAGNGPDDQEYVQGSADAFRTNTRFNAPNSGALDGHTAPSSFAGDGFSSQSGSAGFGAERPQSAQDRAANTLRFESEVGPESFNYAFETDNGIAAEETAVATNGVQAQGAFSYTGDDGQVYSVTYTADEDGYQPKGDHLPTPPPIPEEILKSLEQNARDEAAGLIDDGSYDAQKYNDGSDYSETDNGKYGHGSSGQHNQGSYSSVNNFGRNSGGYGSQAFAAASSGQGFNVASRHRQDSTSESTNINGQSQEQNAFGGHNQAQGSATKFGSHQNSFSAHPAHASQAAQNQNGFSGQGLNNNRVSSSNIQQLHVQGNTQFGHETGNQAKASAFAGQGLNGRKHPFGQASFGQAGSQDSDGAPTANADVVNNQFSSQFSQQSRLGNQGNANRQGGNLNQYLPPFDNKNQQNKGSFQQQSFSQSSTSSNGQGSQPINQFNKQQGGQFTGAVSNQNSFAHSNFQSSQSTTPSHFGGSQTISQVSSENKAPTSFGNNNGQQSASTAFSSESLGSNLNSGLSGFGTNKQSTPNRFGSEGSNLNGQSGSLDTNSRGLTAFSSASFGSQSSNSGKLHPNQGHEQDSKTRFGSALQPNFANSAHASAQFNSQPSQLNTNDRFSQKQFSSGQFGSKQLSGQFGQTQQNGNFASNSGFNQQSSAAAQVNSETENNGFTQNKPFSNSQFGSKQISGQFGQTQQNGNVIANTQNAGFNQQSNAVAQVNSGAGNNGFTQQKPFSKSQFGSKQNAGSFGQNDGNAQVGQITSNKQVSGFNQQFNSAAQINAGDKTDESYHYKQPSKQFGVPTNSQQSSFQSTNQFSSNENSAPTGTQFGAFQQQFSSNTNAQTQNGFNARPQTTSQSGQFQTSHQTQGFQKQTSAIPQSFQPLRQPTGQSQHLSSSASTASQSPSSFASAASQSGISSSEPTVPSQQYNGEIYQYNKPEQTLPSEKDQDGSPSSSHGSFSSSQGFRGTSQLTSSAVAGKGEVFGGPRKAPSFDQQTGYHY